MGLGLENPLHLAILVLVVVLLFGARRLPELGRSLGSGIREFKGSISGNSEEVGEPKAIEPSSAADDGSEKKPEGEAAVGSPGGKQGSSGGG